MKGIMCPILFHVTILLASEHVSVIMSCRNKYVNLLLRDLKQYNLFNGKKHVQTPVKWKAALIQHNNSD